MTMETVSGVCHMVPGDSGSSAPIPHSPDNDANFAAFYKLEAQNTRPVDLHLWRLGTTYT